MMNSINQHGDAILSGEAGPVATLAVGSCLVLATLFAISRQPVSEKKLAFSVSLSLTGVELSVEIYRENRLRSSYCRMSKRFILILSPPGW